MAAPTGNSSRPAPLGPILIVIGVVVLGLLTWFLIRSDGPVLQADTPPASPGAESVDDSLGLGFGASKETMRPASTSGATIVSYAPSPAFARLDIHEVPLGTILDYAVEVVEYDDARARSFHLPRNRHGEAPYVTVTPAEGTWGMTRATMGEGHIVARIQSVGSYQDLGLASGMNFLWVSEGEDGALEWVMVPGTAFAPLHDLSEESAGTLLER